MDLPPPTHNYDDPKLVLLQAQSGGHSAGDYAKITFNDKEVKINKNLSSGFNRGINLVIFSMLSGKEMWNESFDTTNSSMVFDIFCE